MARKDPSFDKSSELSELIARYEESQKNNVNIYLDADQLADIADKYAELERFDDAQQVISYGLRLHPNNTDLLIEQSLLYLDTDQFELAKEVAESIKDSSPEVILLRAELLLNEEKPDEAEKLFQSIKDSENPEQVVDIAYLYKDTGYPQQALNWINTAKEHSMNNKELWMLKAECHIVLQQIDEAIEIFNKLIDLDPFNAGYWTELAKCHFSNQEFTQALNAIDFAIVADDQSGDAHTVRGHILFNLDRVDDSIVAYQQAIQVGQSPRIFAYMFLGLAYNGKEDWKKAEETFQTAIDYLPTEFPMLCIELYLNRATALAHLERYEEALQLCKLAQEYDPAEIEVHLIQGYILYHQESNLAAWDSWDQALQLAPEAETLIRISDYLLEFNNLKGVRRCLEEALFMEPNDENIHGRLAVVNLLLGDEEKFRTHNELSGAPIQTDDLLQFLEGIEDQHDHKDFWKLIDKWKKDLL